MQTDEQTKVAPGARAVEIPRARQAETLREPGRAMQILVVDDTPSDLRLVQRLIEHQTEWSVSTAVDGLDAMEKLAQRKFDLLLTDLRMPRMDGLELVKQVKLKSPRLPIILMTGDGSEEIAVAALQNGASSYVSKRGIEGALEDTIARVGALLDEQRISSKLFGALDKCEVQFTLDNDPSWIPVLIRYLLQVLENASICQVSELTRVAVALEEALANAIYHGNLEVDSKLREKGVKLYQDVARARAQQSPFAERQVHVHASYTPTEARYTVRDEGNGFATKLNYDPLTRENLTRPHGRGLLLMRTFMDEVIYNDIGNEICLVKRAHAS